MQEQPAQQWDAGWEEHSLRQMREIARLPLVKKLEWLEQAHRLVLFMNQSRKKHELNAADSIDPKSDHT